jgi:hypothetical protein
MHPTEKRPSGPTQTPKSSQRDTIPASMRRKNHLNESNFRLSETQNTSQRTPQ